MPQSPAFLLTVLILNLVTDVCIILIPIPIILPLKISWARKLGLLGMFCAGVFIMIAAILRVYFVMAVSTVSIYLTTKRVANTANSSSKPQQQPSGRVEKTLSPSWSARPPSSGPSSPVGSGQAPTSPQTLTRRTNTLTTRTSSAAARPPSSRAWASVQSRIRTISASSTQTRPTRARRISLQPRKKLDSAGENRPRELTGVRTSRTWKAAVSSYRETWTFRVRVVRANTPKHGSLYDQLVALVG